MRRIFILLALLGLTLSACAPATETQPAPVFGEPQIPESEVPRVSLADAKAAFDNGSAVFVDVRSSEAYQTSHVPGAVSVPLDEIENNPAGLNLDKEQWIITYCT